MLKLKTFLSDSTQVLACTTLIAASALVMAFTAQFAFGLAPCTLCLYQRIPFALVIILGLAGLAMKNKPDIKKIMIGLSGIAFLANAAIALYHSGVERHWWQSALEGCHVSFETSDENMLEKLLSTPAVRCDAIPWADPFFGLSMANYNVALCLGLFVLCFLSLTLAKTKNI